MSRPETEADTIAAVSTPPGQGGIGIVRLSGPLALPILRSVFRGPDGRPAEAFPPQRLRYGRIVDTDGAPLDEVLAVFMAAPRTYTREDVAEIHCHGGHAAVREVLRRVIQEGARPAEPGEFTVRAFLNGRIDLTRAEAVMDVVRATTRRSLKAAARQLGGALGRRLSGLRTRLLELLAHVEACIDFSDEEIPGDLEQGFGPRAAELREEMERLLATYDRGRILREGAAVAIVGRPNVGKSSLLNRLLAEDRAIVTEVPGTTRDTIEESFSLHGIPVRLVDTAGIRRSADRVEQEGIRRSRRAVEEADVVLLVLDGSRPLEAADRELLEELRGRRAVVVRNKRDLPPADRAGLDAVLGALSPDTPQVLLSAKTGEGLEGLLDTLQEILLGEAPAAEEVLITRARHRDALRRSRDALENFGRDRRDGAPLEILALDLREALDGLDRILGTTDVEELLGVIFSDFCIGK